MVANMKLISFSLIILLSGCGIREGVVYSKNHSDAYTHLQPMLVGKITTLIPVHHPEECTISDHDN